MMSIKKLTYNCEFWNVMSQKYLKMIFVTNNCEVKNKCEINKIYKHTIVSFEILWDQKYFKIIFVTNNWEVKKKYGIKKKYKHTIVSFEILRD